MTELRIIDAATLAELAPPHELIEWMRTAMIATSRRQVELPLRRGLTLPDGLGMLSVMPGYVGPASAAGVKLVSLVPRERSKGSTHLGLMILYDADGLVPRAVLCGATLTALRTAAVTALATDLLAREDAAVLTILGAGEQAESHLRALAGVRRWDECRIWSRTLRAAERLAGSGIGHAPTRAVGSIDEALRGADVVCTLTSARRPLFDAEAVDPGTHVNLVGSSTADALEADPALVGRSRFFIDFWPSILDQAAELKAAVAGGSVTESHVAAELGEVLAGLRAGRTDDREITVYKSVGIAAQDVVAARHVLDKAIASDRGTLVRI